MVAFLILMAVCGGAASLVMGWASLLLLGLIVIPAATAIIISAGGGLGIAAATAALGYLVLQISYVVSGAVGELRRTRAKPVEAVKKVTPDAKSHGGT